MLSRFFKEYEVGRKSGKSKETHRYRDYAYYSKFVQDRAGGGVVREKRYGKTCKHGEKEYRYIDCEY